MPYCPNHRYEYLPEIKVCPECGAELVDELPPAGDLAPDVEWVPMRSLPGMIYAKMVAEVLDQRGIPNYIQSLFGSGGLGVISGVDFPGADARIWVPEPFLEEAQEIMDDMMKEV
jgi:rubredoxin